MYAHGSRGRTSDVSHILHAGSLCICLSGGALVGGVLDFGGVVYIAGHGLSSDMTMTRHSNSH
jgi:hypothetical protein